MFKKLIPIALVLVLMLALPFPAFGADTKLIIGDKEYTPYPQITIVEGKALAPVSLFTDLLNIDARCSSANQTITLTLNENEVKIDLKNNKLILNGIDAKPVVPFQTLNKHAYVPMNQVASALGMELKWESDTKAVVLKAPADKNVLTIFHAGSLKAPITEMKTKFAKSNPKARIYLESAGSLDCARKVTEQGRKAEIIASADYSVFDQLMIPKYTDWYAMFAENEMVLCYTGKSKSAGEITKDNWFDVLMKPEVKFSHTNPDLDPAGYRSLMVWQLAEKHYKKANLYADLDKACPKGQVYDSATDLVTALQTGKIDFAFEYLSVAKQNNFKYVTLPNEINLSSPSFAEFYKTAKATTQGTSPGTTVDQVGSPIVYAVTVPNNAPNQEIAYQFVKFMLGDEGQSIMTAAGQIPIAPAEYNNNAKIPSALK